MPRLFLNNRDLLNTAQYVYKGILSQPFSLEHAEDNAIFLLKNGDILLSSDKKRKALANNQIVKILYHPQKGLGYFMIKVAMIPFVVDFYSTIFPEESLSKTCQSLPKEELENVQRMLFFHELKNGALEYLKYCNNHKLYASAQSLYEDCLVLAQMNSDKDKELYELKIIFTEKGLTQPASLSTAKQLLMKEAMKLAQFSLLLDESIEPLFELAASSPDALRAFVAFLQTLSEMAKKMGLHHTDFIETSPALLKPSSPSINLRETLIQDAGSYSKQIFAFWSEDDVGRDLDVVLAYQTLTRIELPDFTALLKPYSPPKEGGVIEDPSKLISFNPAVEINKDKISANKLPHLSELSSLIKRKKL